MGPVQPEPPAFWIGVSVSPLEPALRAQLKLPQNQGLLAIDVVKDSPAAQADVKVHDILLSLDGKLLDSQEKLVELVQSNGEKSVPLELIREGKTQTIRCDAPAAKAGAAGQSLADYARSWSSYQVVSTWSGRELRSNPTAGLAQRAVIARTPTADGTAERDPAQATESDSVIEAARRSRRRDQATAQGDRGIEQDS